MLFYLSHPKFQKLKSNSIEVIIIIMSNITMNILIIILN